MRSQQAVSGDRDKIFSSSEDEEEPLFSQSSKYDKPIMQWMLKPALRKTQATLPTRSFAANELPVAPPIQRDPPAGDDDSSLTSLELDEVEAKQETQKGDPKGNNAKRKAEVDDGPLNQKRKKVNPITVKEMVRQQREQSPNSASFDAVGNNRNPTKSLRKKYVRKEAYKGK